MFDRFNSDARSTVMFAAQEARDLGHREIGTDHLVLGMLCNARSPLFTLLGEYGLTLAGARQAVTAFHAEHATDSAAAEAEDAKARYEDDREALRSIGIDLDRVREAIGDRFGEDLTEGWGERATRGRGRGRGHRRGHDCGTEGRGPGGRGPGGDMRGGPWGRDGMEGGPWERGRGRRGPRGGGRLRMTDQARTVLRDAIVRARTDQGPGASFSAEYLLLGILDSADPAALAVIASATTVDDLRAAVVATLPDVAAR